MWPVQTHILDVAIHSRTKLPVCRRLKHVFAILARVSGAVAAAVVTLCLVIWVALVIADGRLKGVFSITALHVLELATHLATFLHDFLYLDVFFVWKVLLFLTIEVIELTLHAVLHLCTFHIANVPLLAVKGLACLSALQKGKVGRVRANLFSVEGEVM